MKQMKCILVTFIYLFHAGGCKMLLPAEMTELDRIWFLDGDGVPHLINKSKTEDHFVLDSDDISFQLYTSAHPTYYIPLIPSEDVNAGDFDSERKTSIVIHGWISSPEKMANIRKAYLERGGYNVIMVDWSKAAYTDYITAKDNVRSVAEQLATLTDFLAKYHHMRLEDVNLIGHSLGAQVAGIVGNITKTGKVGKITGLDPALPLFGDEPLQNRLDCSDAKFVEVIHTCGGLLGWMTPIGHADFFPNQGISIQPGCGLDLGGACSHSRSHEYFAESITTTKGFVSYECSSWDDYNEGKCFQNLSTLMGEFTNTSSRGTFYLKTSDESPFALGDPTHRE